MKAKSKKKMASPKKKPAKKATTKKPAKKATTKKPAKKATTKKPAVVEPNEDEKNVIVESCGGDMKVVEFFLAYLRKGRNATEAYLSLRPNMDRNSAKTLGSRMLSKVDRTLLMEFYGVGVEKYLTKLDEGLGATKLVTTGSGEYTDIEEAPDYAVRRQYHQVQGEILGFEKKGAAAQVGIQINNNQAINKKAEEYEF